MPLLKGKDDTTDQAKKAKLPKRGKNTPWWHKYQVAWAEQFYFRPPEPPDNYDWKAKTMEIYKAREADESNKLVVCEDYHSFVQNLHTTSTIYSRDTDDEAQPGGDIGGGEGDSDEGPKQWEDEKELSESSDSDAYEGKATGKPETEEMKGSGILSLFGKKKTSFSQEKLSQSQQQRLSLSQQPLSTLPQTTIELKKEEKGSDYEADYENDDVSDNTDMYSSDEDAKPFRIFGETSSSSSENETSGDDSTLSELTEQERAEYNKYIEDYFKDMMDDLEANNVTESSLDDEEDSDNAIDLSSTRSSEHQLEAFFTLVDKKIEESKQQQLPTEHPEVESGSGSDMELFYSANDLGGPGALSKMHSDTIVTKLPEPKMPDPKEDLHSHDELEELINEQKGSQPVMNMGTKLLAKLSEDRILADLGLTANERALAKQVMADQRAKAEAEKLKQNKKIWKAITFKTCWMYFFLLCFWALACLWIYFVTIVGEEDETLGVVVYKYYYTMSARIPLIINILIPIFGVLRRSCVGIRFFATIFNMAIFYYVMVHLFILIPLTGDIAKHYMSGGLEELMMKRMVQTKVSSSDPLYVITKNWGIGNPVVVTIADVHKVWDKTQKLAKCCGITGPKDWKNAPDAYPSSCCINGEDPCLKDNSTGKAVYPIWEKGCFDTEWDKVKVHSLWYLILCCISIVIACCTYIIFWNFYEYLKVHRPYWVADIQDTYSADNMNMKDFPRKTSSLDLPSVTYFNMEAFNKDIYGIWPQDGLDIDYPYSSLPEYSERQVLVLPRDQLRG